MATGEDELGRRLRELTHQEAALRKLVESVQAQRAELDERERALAARAGVTPPPPPKPPEPEPKPQPEPEPAARPPAPKPTPTPAAPRELTLARLEQIVQDGRERGDPRVVEWEIYLPILRGHADTDGRLPERFEGLAESVFGDALRT